MSDLMFAVWLGFLLLVAIIFFCFGYICGREDNTDAGTMD